MLGSRLGWDLITDSEVLSGVDMKYRLVNRNTSRREVWDGELFKEPWVMLCSVILRDEW
jgi:hypothetical protein